MRYLTPGWIASVFFFLYVPKPAAQPPRRPFPQHVTLYAGAHIPDHVRREELDDSVRAFYSAWKKRYIRKGCGPGQYYVWFEGGPGHTQCVSEGQGYGMVITALMAGYDTSARTQYDGLFRYYRAHPGRGDPSLMAWAQKKGCRDMDGTTATDGDMDIAYSLLLADAQWGSRGPIRYLQEGQRMIAAIMNKEINHAHYSMLLGNSIEEDSKDFSDMRASDFMPAHFRAFLRATGDSNWSRAIGDNYRLFGYMQERYSPEAGLLPDFIRHISAGEGPHPSVHAVPAGAHYLESRYDGCYYYNACRVPWRVGLDVLLHGDQRALGMEAKINRWIRSTTRNEPDNISAGYTLDGVDLPRHYFEALSFITPFAISAMTDRSAGGQAWLDKLWGYIIRFRLRSFDYYDNSIKMIGLIVLSGNYWAP
ncbi:MAG: glycosyl hydrolase family 8 [Bacteroidota bacterium]|nr:glycosyl hydrolase family 8 [Bacteroidota bacterium]